jgi:hypothetical protein
MKTAEERILCAAIWFNDGLKHEHQPKGIPSGYVVAGRRHHNVYITHSIISKGAIVSDKLITAPSMPQEQGFLTSLDRFITRQEAAELAFENGQIKKRTGQLFSEDLY